MIRSLPSRVLRSFRSRFERLYGAGQADDCLRRLLAMIGRYGVGAAPQDSASPHESGPADIMLIAYADHVRSEGQPPLAALREFLQDHVGDRVNTVHLLPFFPSTSDDGFSVSDHRAVDPAFGDWEDVADLSATRRLAFDLVLNHASSRGRWMRDFVRGVSPARNFFIEVDPATDLSSVVRPRTHPLLTPFLTRRGTVHLWTTFSADQVDLDWSRPDVLFEFLDILMFYISEGARIIRLDAVAFLWKKAGTSCLHLPETHEVVRLMRDLVDLVSPGVMLLTETNVPHAENVSYFGTGDEAHMVYQFSLPPLLLHTFLSENAAALRHWAASLDSPPPGCQFLNFTASHDGIGVRPLQDLVGANDLERLVKHVTARGGRVSMRSMPGGIEVPYELNITWFDAMGHSGADPHHVARFLSSQAVMLALQGMPAVYLPSLFGARNDQAGLQETGRARSLNRQKWNRSELDRLIGGGHPLHTEIFRSFMRLLEIRGVQPAFHPRALQTVLDRGPGIFAFVRRSTAPEQAILCATNVTSRQASLDALPLPAGAAVTDLITGLRHQAGPVTLQPFQTAWLTA